ncbi:MAG: 2-C-methyl-D-erythritol 2,4-cyclodiphosphate synthase [Fibrobacterota bacterium]
MDFRIGSGFDAHRLVAGRDCIIGHVKIPHDQGLLGHSDADVLLHAVADALLGALALGDIGKHFPDTDPAYQGADSLALLARVFALVEQKGFVVANVDATLMAQAPKMAPHVPAMCAHIARCLKVATDRVSVKATTTEGMGFTGRGEGIAASAVVLVYKA